jgi:hypothetical protein
LADAAPGIQSTLQRGLNVAREKLAGVDLPDDDMPSESSSASENDEEEESVSSSEGEQDDEQPDEIITRLRSKSQQVASSGKKAARDIASKGRRAMDEAADAADTLTSKARSAASRGRRALEDAAEDAQEEGEELASQARGAIAKGKRMIEESSLPEQAERTTSRIGRGLRDLAGRAVESGEHLVDRARHAASSTAAEFNFEDAKGKIQEAVLTSRRGGQKLADEVDARIPTEAKDKPHETTSRLSRGASALKHRARDALHDAEEQLSMSDAEFTRAAGRGLAKFDRVVERDNNMRLPLVVIGVIFALWLGASLYQLLGTPNEPPPPENLYESAKLAMHDLRTSGMEGLQHLQDKGQRLADRLQGKPAPATWSDKLGELRDSVWGWGAKVPTQFDLAKARDGIRQARDTIEEATYATKHMLDERVKPRLQDGVEYTRERLIPSARHGIERVGDEVKYHADHADEYAARARRTAEDYNLVEKQSLGGRMWAWLTGKETLPQQGMRKAAELRDHLMPQPTLLERIRARMPWHHSESLLDKVQRNIPDLDIDPRATAEEYYAKALEKGYELKDGVYQLTHRSLADRIRSHLPGHRDTVLEKVQRNIPDLDDFKGTAQDYYAAAMAKGYELKDGAYKLTHRSLADRLRSYWPFHQETLLEKAQRNVRNLDPSLSAQEYYNRAVALGYELKDGVYELVHPTLMDRLRAHMPGHSGSPLLEKLKGSIPHLDIDPKATAEEYYAKALEKGYELKDGAYKLTHRSLADRIRAHLPGHRDTVLERVQRNVPELNLDDAKMTARDYYAAALAKGYELKDGAYKLTHRSLGDRLRSYWPFHQQTLLEKAQRNIADLDVSGTAQEYYDRAVAAGYDLRDGAYELVRPSLMDRLRAHLPGHSGSPLLEKLKGSIPGLDVDPKATAEDYYARALEKGYELKDGAYQLTHRSLADRIRAHLPGHHDGLIEKLRGSIPELRGEIDPRATAEEYLAKALEKGYEIQDGVYKLTHRSLADRIRAHLTGASLPSMHGHWNTGDALSERIVRNVPNLDVAGSAKEYFDRARAAGYELRNGAYQLADHAREGVPDAMAQARQNLHAMHTTEPIGQQQQQAAGQPVGTHIPLEGVPLSEVKAEMAHAEPLPDPLAHATPMPHIHSAGTDNAVHHRQTLAQSIKSGVNSLKDDAVNLADRLRAHLPGGHNLRKEAEYAGHRTAHHAEAAGHRVQEGVQHAHHRTQEGVQYAQHRTQEGMQYAGHRAQEAAHTAKDHMQRHL